MWQTDKDSNVYGVSRLTQNFKELTIKSQIDNQRNHKITGEYIPSDDPDIKLRTELYSKIGEEYFNKNSLLLDYSYSNLKGTLSVTQGCLLKFKSVFGKKIGLGVDLTYAMLNPRFIDYNGILFYIENDRRFVIKHESRNQNIYELGMISVSGFRVFENIKIAGELKKEPKRDIDFRVGIEYEYDKQRSIKARLAGNELSAAFRVAINTNLTIISAAKIKHLSDLTNMGFGLKIKINS